jgi:hypothetical protein
MSQIWLPIIAGLAGILLIRAARVACASFGAMAAKYPAEWSQTEFRYLQGLRLATGFGLIIVWIALVHADSPAQLWQANGGAPLGLTLIYSIFWLGLIGPTNWNRFGTPLAGRTISGCVMFLAAMIVIAV